MKTLAVLVALLLSTPVFAETLLGRWKLIGAEDFRADGSVVRYPWGKQPLGSIVVEDGNLFLQIFSGDVPSFSKGGVPVGEQMQAAIRSSYVGYTHGPCTVNDAQGIVTCQVEAGEPEYRRFFHFENGKLFYGPPANSVKIGTEILSRRLIFVRAEP